MKFLRAVFVLIPILVITSGNDLFAQKKRAERTSSGMAAYGVVPEPAKYKRAKVKKVRKKVPSRPPRIKEPKATRTKKSEPSFRKKNNWAS